jgi:formate dehydrogenase iron-sulfur subunit
MTTRVYLPRDASALSLGADAVAAALLRAGGGASGAPSIELVRTGSRGLVWLEPLLEVDTPAGRIGYGPVSAAEVPGLIAAGALDGSPHPLRLGPVDALPWLTSQQRLTFARVGIIDPTSLAAYRQHGGYQGLERALAMAPDAIVKVVTDSGLRGRGGAAFPTGIKWKTVLDAPATQKYVTCNADEGDSGTFSDRMLMEGDPFALIEGMTIAGLAVNATHGYIYVRVEYPEAVATLNAAIRAAYADGCLGRNLGGSGKRFDLSVRVGAGAYICGEETSMLESLEGKRGEVRVRPPLPAVKGLFGQPTIVNNVISLATVPVILARGAEFYKDFGTGRSRGTLPVQLAGNIKRGGLIERAFGVTLKELLYDYGGGSLSGRPIRAAQVGGPLGAYVPASQFDTPLDYEAFAGIGAMLGHGGIVVFDDTVDMAKMARYAFEFCALESCGKCTPCRIGSARGVGLIDNLLAGRDPARQRRMIDELCETMIQGSLCGLGGMAPFPVRSALTHFGEDFAPRARH